MPLLMINLVEEGDCTILSIPISSDPLEFTCSNFTPCENGVKMLETYPNAILTSANFETLAKLTQMDTHTAQETQLVVLT